MRHILFIFRYMNESIPALFSFGLAVLAAFSVIGIFGAYMAMAQYLLHTEHSILGKLAYFCLASFVISAILSFVCFGAGEGDLEQEDMEGETVAGSPEASKGSESAPAERTITAPERIL